MPAMNYSTLVGNRDTEGSIKNIIKWDAAPSEAILEDAQNWVFSQLRVREMRTYREISLAQGEGSSPLPEGHLETLVMVRPHGGDFIDPMTDADFMVGGRILTGEDATTLQPSIPSRYAIFDEAYHFNCLAQEAMVIPTVYFAPKKISKEVPSTFMCTRYSHIMRHACWAFAALHYDDKEVYETQATLAGGWIEKANVESDFGRAGLMSLIRG